MFVNNPKKNSEIQKLDELIRNLEIREFKKKQKLEELKRNLENMRIKQKP